VIAIFPDLWVNIFTDDPSVRAASRQYLSTAAPMYAFIGLSISMYFSSQGAAKVVGRCWRKPRGWCSSPPAAGGWRRRCDRGRLLRIGRSLHGGARPAVGASVIFTRWGPKGGPAPDIRAALS
jgi:hypothetical protein